MPAPLFDANEPPTTAPSSISTLNPKGYGSKQGISWTGYGIDLRSFSRKSSNMTEEIRWTQRFDNFKRSLKLLDDAIAIIADRELNDLEKQGVIQAFEYNYELAWNVIKDFFEYQGGEGTLGLLGSRDAFRLAFRRGLIKNGEVWMDMIKSRQLTSHTYNEDVAAEILEDIVEKYYPEFVALKETLTQYLA